MQAEGLKLLLLTTRLDRRKHAPIQGDGHPDGGSTVRFPAFSHSLPVPERKSGRGLHH